MIIRSNGKVECGFRDIGVVDGLNKFPGETRTMNGGVGKREGWIRKLNSRIRMEY